MTCCHAGIDGYIPAIRRLAGSADVAGTSASGVEKGTVKGTEKRGRHPDRCASAGAPPLFLALLILGVCY